MPSLPAGGPTAVPTRPHRGRAALVAALATVLLWQLALAAFMPHELGDENHHVPAIRALARGQPLPRALPMPPAFHWLLALPGRVLGTPLWVLRVFEGLLGIATVLVYAGIVRRLHPHTGGFRLLLLAWHPLVFPYFGLVYTDLASLLAVLAALYLHLRARHILAAGALLLACLVRQSSLVWVLFMVCWRLLESRRPAAPAEQARDNPVARIVAVARRERLWLHGLILLGGAAYLLRGGGLVPAEIIDNRPQFNPAQFYLLAMVVALLWLPVWGPTLVAWWRPILVPTLLRPWPCAAAILSTGLLIVGFRNPHPWNTALVFLHNWPLWLVGSYPVLRVLVAAALVAFVAVQARITWQGTARPALVLVWMFTVLFLFPHYLADARYYIIPAVLLDVFTPYTPTESRRLGGWYLVLSIGVAAFILSRPTHIGGP